MKPEENQDEKMDRSIYKNIKSHMKERHRQALGEEFIERTDESRTVDPREESRRTHRSTPGASSTPNIQRSLDDDNEERIAARVADGLIAALGRVNGNRRHRPSCKFSGKPHEDPETFLRKITTFFHDNDIEDGEERMEMIGDLLQGEAKAWFSRFEDFSISYQHFKDKFRRKYSSLQALEEGKRALHNEEQREGEDTEIFITRKWNLITRFEANLPTSAKIELIAGKLLPELSYPLQDRYFTDIEVFIQAVQKVERTLARRTSRPAQPERGSARERIFPAAQRQYQTAPTPTPRTRPAEARPSTSTRPPHPCRFCNAWHYHSECPQNPYRRGSGNGRAGDSRNPGPARTPNANQPA